MASNITQGPRSTEKMTYEQAQMYCFMFKHDGKSGWRLPKFNEFIDGDVWYQDAEITKRKWFVRPVKDIKL